MKTVQSMYLIEENKLSNLTPFTTRKESRSVFPLKESTSSILKTTKRIVLSSTSYKEFLQQSALSHKIRFKSPQKLKFPPIESGTFHLTSRKGITPKQAIKPFYCYNTQDKNTAKAQIKNQINISSELSINLNGSYASYSGYEQPTNRFKKIQNEPGKFSIQIEDLYDKQSFLKKIEGMEVPSLANYPHEEAIEYLKTKLGELVNSGTENLTSNKSKTFYSTDQKKTYKIELAVKSVYVRIKENKKNMTLLDEMTAELPFSLLPLFYFTSISNFNLILSQILKFDQSFTRCSLDLDKLPKILKVFEYKILNNCTIPPDAIFYSKSSNFTIDIITPNKILQMTVYAPSVNLAINDSSTGRSLIFKKVLSKYASILVLQKNFVKWDIQILDYLTEYKTFREATLNFTNTNLLNSKRKGKFDNEISYVDLDNLTERNLKTKLSEENSFEIIAAPSHNNRHLFIKMSVYKAKVSLIPTNNSFVGFREQKLFSFDFNFKQSVQLERIGILNPIEDFLNRCVLHRGRGKNKYVEMDYHVIDNVDDDYLHFLTKTAILDRHSKSLSPEKEKEKEIMSPHTNGKPVIEYPSLHCLGVVEVEGLLQTKNITIEIPSEVMIKFERIDEIGPSHIIKQFLSEVIISLEQNDKDTTVIKSRSSSKMKTSTSPQNQNRKSLNRRSTFNKLSLV